MLSLMFVLEYVHCTGLSETLYMSAWCWRSEVHRRCNIGSWIPWYLSSPTCVKLGFSFKLICFWNVISLTAWSQWLVIIACSDTLSNSKVIYLGHDDYLMSIQSILIYFLSKPVVTLIVMDNLRYWPLCWFWSFGRQHMLQMSLLH